jgi:hypothetical protein
MVVGMSTRPSKPEPSATPEVVVENLRATVYASHEEISVQVQADGGLDSKLLGLLGFFVAAAGILLTLPHGLDHGRFLLLAGAVFGALVCLVAIVGGSIPSAGPRASEFYGRYGTNAEVGYQTQLLADLANTAKRNRGGLKRHEKALAFAIRVPFLFAIAYGLLSLR